MIVDTSAVIAIVREEPDAHLYARAMLAGRLPRMSVANHLEAAVVVDASRDPVASRRFDDLVDAAGLVLEPVTVEQAAVARAAYRDFGTGSGHPARLNFGDCFAYALARTRGDTLLFKGDDFRHTDISPAI